MGVKQNTLEALGLHSHRETFSLCNSLMVHPRLHPREGSICGPWENEGRTVEGGTSPLPITAAVWNHTPNLPHSSLQLTDCSLIFLPCHIFGVACHALQIQTWRCFGHAVSPPDCALRLSCVNAVSRLTGLQNPNTHPTPGPGFYSFTLPPRHRLLPTRWTLS